MTVHTIPLMCIVQTSCMCRTNVRMRRTTQVRRNATFTLHLARTVRVDLKMPRAKAKSLCCVCCKAVEDGKDEALLCKGQYQKWLHRYCAGVTVDQYEELSSSEEPFLCFTCCRAQHQQQIIELRGEIEALKFELSQLKAQLQPPPRPQISSNEVVERYPPLSAERQAMPENSSWQPVEEATPT